MIKKYMTIISTTLVILIAIILVLLSIQKSLKYYERTPNMYNKNPDKKTELLMVSKCDKYANETEIITARIDRYQAGEESFYHCLVREEIDPYQYTWRGKEPSKETLTLIKFLLDQKTSKNMNRNTEQISDKKTTMYPSPERSKDNIVLPYGTGVIFDVSSVGVSVYFNDFSIARLSDAVIKKELGIDVQKTLLVFKVVSNAHKDQMSYIYWTSLQPSLQPLDGGKDFVIDGKVYVIKLNPVYESLNRRITEDDNGFQIDVSKKSISEIQAMQTAVHPFPCPNMVGFSFTYQLSEGWNLENSRGIERESKNNYECKVYLSWRESAKPSAYISVNRLEIDRALAIQNMKVNPHRVHYVSAVQGGSWASKDPTAHDFGQSMDFYFTDTGVRVTYRLLESEKAEGPKPFDKELFFKSVVDSFNITEHILKVGKTVNLLKSAGKVMNIIPLPTNLTELSFYPIITA